MNLFKKYKYLYWPPPSYERIGQNLSRDKSAAWIELFLDLSFVIAIAIQSQAIMINSSNVESIIAFGLGFMMLFIIWRSSTFYNQLFYSNTLRSRLITFGHIICALMLVIFTYTGSDFSQQKYIVVEFPYMLTAGITSIYIGAIWMSAWWHLYKITKQDDVFSLRSRFWGIVNTSAGILLLIASFFHLQTAEYPQQWILYLYGIIVMSQFFGVLIQRPISRRILEKNAQKHGSKSVYTTDHVDAGHTMERFGLFILLLIGEMFLGIVQTLKLSLTVYHFVVFLLLLLVVICIFWIYFDQVAAYTFKTEKLPAWTIIQFFTALNLLYMATYNREVLVDFHRYFYHINITYIFFFIILIAGMHYIDNSSESARIETQLDLRLGITELRNLRIATVIVMIVMLFIPFPNGLVYMSVIVLIFVIHVVFGMYIFFKNLDEQKKD